MPSFLSSPRTDVRRANLQRAQQLRKLQTISIRGPWLGYIPDIDHNKLPGQALTRVLNLRSNAPIAGNAQAGEALISAPGYEHVNRDNLPLYQVNSENPGGGWAPDTTRPLGESPVLLLGEIFRTNTTGGITGDFDRTPYALVGDSEVATNACGFYVIPPSTGNWTAVRPAVTADSLIDMHRDGALSPWDGSYWMPSATVCPFGLSDTDPVPNDAGNTQPILVIATPNNEIVYYPTGSAHTVAANRYARLGHDAANGWDVAAGGYIRARSVASWNGRLYLLNTEEKKGGAGATQHTKRLRRTVKGNASNFFGPGAGARDIVDFDQKGIRLEVLGRSLAIYFEDGVALAQETGIAANPEVITILTKKRGLMGTHAMTAIGEDRHFCIMTDGWFILDSNGSFTEVGTTQIDNILRYKWKDTFYRTLDYTYRHRIQCVYDRFNRQVLISIPTVSQGNPDDITTATAAQRLNNNEVWVYDLATDRVFIDEYPVTVFGELSPSVRVALRYGEVDDAGDATPAGWEAFFDPPTAGATPFPPTYAGMRAAGLSYAEVGALSALRDIAHANREGIVMIHSNDIIYRNADNDATNSDQLLPSYIVEFGTRSIGASKLLYTVDRAIVEYITWRPNGIPNPGTTLTLFSGSDANTQFDTIALNEGNQGEAHIARYWFRFTNNILGSRLTGQSPVAIRAIDMELWVHDDVEIR